MDVPLTLRRYPCPMELRYRKIFHDTLAVGSYIANASLSTKTPSWHKLESWIRFGSAPTRMPSCSRFANACVFIWRYYDPPAKGSVSFFKRNGLDPRANSFRIWSLMDGDLKALSGGVWTYPCDRLYRFGTGKKNHFC